MTRLSVSQLNRLGERLRKGHPSDDDLRILDDFRLSFALACRQVSDELFQIGLTPVSRPAKSTNSIVAKLNRERSRLSKMQDIAGCRVEVEDLDAQDLAVAAILKRFPQGLVYDRRLKPSHGYRSVHIVVVASDCAVEIQVRTALQHGWASTVERLSDRLDPDIKYGGGPEALRLHLLTWSKIIEQVEALAERGRLLRQGQASGSEIDALEVQMGRLQADLKQALVRIILLEEDAAAKS